MFRSLRTPIIATQVKAGQGELLVSDALGEHKLTPVGPRFVDENGTPAAFKEDDNGNVAYMYYTAIDSMSEKLAEPRVQRRSGRESLCQGYLLHAVPQGF